MGRHTRYNPETGETYEPTPPCVVNSGCVHGYLWFTLLCVCGETVKHNGFRAERCKCGRQLILGGDYSSVTVDDGTGRVPGECDCREEIDDG